MFCAGIAAIRACGFAAATATCASTWRAFPVPSSTASTCRWRWGACSPASAASSPTLLGEAAQRLALTARSLDRVLKVALTIADLDGAPEITERHLAEALQYRGLERTWPRPEE